MDHQGHGMDLNHDIFQKPNVVTFDYIEQDRPKHYDGATSPLYPNGVANQYKLAQFERKKPSTPNPTIVSHEGFFTECRALRVSPKATRPRCSAASR